MVGTLASLTALFASLAILLLGGGLLGTLLAVRMATEGWSSSVIGIVMAGYPLGFVLATLWSRRLIETVGHIRSFAAFAAIAACTALLHGLFFNVPVWIAMRIAFGFSLASLYMITESWLNDRTPREFRGQVLATYGITTSVSLGLGQFLLNAWDVSGYQLFSLAAILLAAGLVPVSVMRIHSPEIVVRKRVSLRELHAISPLGMVGAGAAGLINGSFFALGPVFALLEGFSAREVATFMGAAVLGGLLIQWGIGHFSDRYDRRRLIVLIGLLVAGVSGMIAMFGGVSRLVLIGFAVVWGGMAFSLYSLSLALANDFMEPEERVPAGATLLLMHGIGMILGPLIMSGLMEPLGAGGLFWGIGAVSLLLAFFGQYRHRVGERIVVAEQEAFVPVGQPTPLSAELDPRAEIQLEFDFEFPESESDENADREAA